MILKKKRCATPKLTSFKGRARDFSPKAKIRMWLGYEKPFDRHDWMVDRCGKEVRYIIDYYGNDKDDKIGVHLDIRPALDSFENVYDRLKMYMGKSFSWLGSTEIINQDKPNQDTK